MLAPSTRVDQRPGPVTPWTPPLDPVAAVYLAVSPFAIGVHTLTPLDASCILTGLAVIAVRS